MRISRRDRLALADTINAIAVYTAMESSHHFSGEERSPEDIAWAWSRKSLAVVRLADEFGIELPGLEHSRQQVNAGREQFMTGLSTRSRRPT